MNGDPNRELTLTRLIDAPRARIFAAWTDPALLARWWAPQPLTTPVVEIDPVAGGRFHTVMRMPDGGDFPTEGVFLEVVPDAKLAFTDAFTTGWVPQPNPFMAVTITLEDEDGKTRYTARVGHWSVENRERHEAMGFHGGWGRCLEQLAALVERPPQTV